MATLVFVARTVRHQGEALGLQIRQLEAEREKQERDRLREEGEERQRRMNNARRVKFSTWQIEHNPREHYDDYSPPTFPPEDLVAEEMLRETGATPWIATVVDVENGSDMVMRNFSFHGEGVPRPKFIWRTNATRIMAGYELDQLGPGGTAAFIFVGIKESSFQIKKPELQFSDEDGYRWRTGLDSHTARIDDLRA